MVSRSRLALACSGALLVAATAACHPRQFAEVKLGRGSGIHVSTIKPMETAVSVAGTLDCPSQIGDLKRVVIGADGASCDYESQKGAVHLATVAAQADPNAALAPLREQLDAELPGVAQNATIQVISESGADGSTERKRVDMPFLHVDDDGRRSHVRLFGIAIDSDSKHGRNADRDDDDDDAEGKATLAAPARPPTPRGVALTYVLVGGEASRGGYHVVGYVAKGPPGGKLVVATFRYVNGEKTWRDGDRHDDDVDQLMKLNVKPA